MISTKERKRYLRMMIRYYPNYTLDKRRFKKEMQDSINTFINTHPDATLDDIYLRYGNPQKFKNQKIKIIKLKLYTFYTIILACLFSISMILIGYCIQYAYNQYIELNGHGETTLIIPAPGQPYPTSTPEPDTPTPIAVYE